MNFKNMENKYDNEFVRKQLYDIYGKPKGIVYEDFSDELDKMVIDFNEQSIEHDEFMEKYRKEHEVCPKCGGKEHTTTLMAYTMFSDVRELYRDLNSCKCQRCGDVHTAHERVPKTI